MQRLRSGVMLCLALGSLSSCRSTIPPKIPICIDDGVGGKNCIMEDGTKKYVLPSEAKNMWSTTQAGMALFSSWCYGADQKVVEEEMNRISQETSK